MIKTAIIHTTYGPYHLARAKALTQVKGIDPSFIELTRDEQTHPWEVGGKPRPVPVISLSESPFERCRARDLSRVLEKTLQGIDPDVVISCGYGHSFMRAAARWARRYQKASILFHVTNREDRRRYWLKEQVKRWIVRHYYDAAFVGGSRHRCYLVELGMPAERIWEPYDVVDTEYFATTSEMVRIDPTRWQERLGLPDQYFLYIGRLSPEKNLIRLLDAYRQYRKRRPQGWHLVLVGDGPQKAELEHFVTVNGIEDILWCGFRQIDELPAYYALSSCFILPSTSEPWGLVVNEAMACGLPVLVSRQCGCIPELVSEEQNGFTFNPDDSSALSELLERVTLLDESTWHAMGIASQKIIARYTPQVSAENLAQCIRTVMEEKREAGA